MKKKTINIIILLFLTLLILGNKEDSTIEIYRKIEDDYALFSSVKKGASETLWQKAEKINTDMLNSLDAGHIYSNSTISVTRLFRYFEIENDADFYNAYLEFEPNRSKVYSKSEWDNLNDEEKYNLYFGVRYVTTSGNNANNGLSEGSAWATIAYGISQAYYGDVVYVKSGTYNVNGDANATTRAGTLSNPISIIGYKNTIGDVVAIGGSTYTRDDFTDDSKVLSGVEMPLILNDRGLDKNPSNDDRGFSVDHSYIHISNFQIQYHDYGVMMDVYSATGVVLDNLVINELGNWDDTDPSYGNAYWPGEGITGKGIALEHYSTGGPDGNTIKNCVVFDAGSVGYLLSDGSNNNVLENNKAYYTRIGNGMDYMLEILDSDNNTITNQINHRELSNQGHASRGILLRCSDNNVIKNVEINNTYVVLENFSSGNEFRDVTIQGSGNDLDGGIRLTGEPELNYFYNFHVDGAQGIKLEPGTGEFCGASGTEKASINNYFINPIFTNIRAFEGIIEANYQVVANTASAGSVTLINGVFDDMAYMYQNRRTNDSYTFINCAFSDILTGYEYEPDGDKALTYTYMNCNFYNCNFTTPTGTNITTYNPLFTDSANGDYTLQSSSNLIDAGTDATSYLATSNKDFNGDTRSGSWDIGAYEYGATTTPVSNDVSFYTAEAKAELVDRFANGYVTGTGFNDDIAWAASEVASFTADPDEFREVFGENRSCPNARMNMFVSGVYAFAKDSVGLANTIATEMLASINSNDLTTSFWQNSQSYRWDLDYALYVQTSHVMKMYDTYHLIKGLQTVWSASDIEDIEDWFALFAGYAYDAMYDRIDNYFGTDWHLNGISTFYNEGEYPPVTGAPQGGRPIYDSNGNATFVISWAQDSFNNRNWDMIEYIHSWAIENNDATKEHWAREFFKLTIKYGLFPDGTWWEMIRNKDEVPYMGVWYCNTSIGAMVKIAHNDAMAQNYPNDLLYDYETTEGILYGSTDYTTEGYVGTSTTDGVTPKSLYTFLKGISNYYRTEANGGWNDIRFYKDSQDSTLTALDPSGYNQPSVVAAMANLYYKDQDLEDYYKFDTSVGYPVKVYTGQGYIAGVGNDDQGPWGKYLLGALWLEQEDNFFTTTSTPVDPVEPTPTDTHRNSKNRRFTINGNATKISIGDKKIN